MKKSPSALPNRTANPPLWGLREAIALHERGHWREAEQRYTLILAADPRQFDARYRLGCLQLQQQRFTDAAHQLRWATKLDKTSADAHHQLAVALTGMGRLEEAVKHYRKAIAIEPGCAEAHNNLGHALALIGQPQQAIREFEKALVLNPSYAEAHNNLGSTLDVLCRSEQAIAHYQQALRLNPKYLQAYLNLGAAYYRLRRFEQAIAQYQTAVALDPAAPKGFNALGKAFHASGRSQDAIASYRKAIALRAGYHQAHHNLGNALLALGKPDEARHAFETAISLQPRKAAYYLSLANSKRFSKDDCHFGELTKLGRDLTSLSQDEQIALHFALGKALADVGEPRQSFNHLLAGNALVRKQISYDEVATLRRFDRIKRVFGPELMRAKQGLGDPSPTPIFIVGMPRSGTTLVEQILASHPKVFGAGELRTLGNLVDELKGQIRFPEVVTTMSQQQLCAFAETYLSSIRRLAPQAERIIDKMPGNFRFAGLIHLALPNARIIHTRRDARDLAISCFSLRFAEGQEFSYNLAELGRYCRAYQVLCAHWRQLLPATVLLEVNYEELVENLEQQARRIVQHCGLEWDDRCLAFYATERLVRTASATQVRQPIYRSSIGRWHQLEDLLQPLLRGLQGQAERQA